MYKVDLKILKEITNFLDSIENEKTIDFGYFFKIAETEKKAKVLSQKIKDNYTEIKP